MVEGVCVGVSDGLGVPVEVDVPVTEEVAVFDGVGVGVSLGVPV